MSWNSIRIHTIHFSSVLLVIRNATGYLWGAWYHKHLDKKFSLPSLQCSSSCWRRSPSAGVSLPWRESMRSRNTWDHSAQCADSTRQIWRWIKNEDHSLGHLGYVFVSQAHPQVIILMQKNLLLTGVPNATGLIPAGEEDTDTDWQPQKAGGIILNQTSAAAWRGKVVFSMDFLSVCTCRHRCRWVAGRSP